MNIERAQLLAEKYSEQFAKTFSREDIDMLERACNLLKGAENKLAGLKKAEEAILSGKKRVAVCLVERGTMALILVKSYFVSCTFEAKKLLAQDYSDALCADHNLFVMKYC